ncbi:MULTISPECIES: bifunctional demethylmenaquinone methyltransferase/2-methoxy-6-polyprenyl-1,4-benzoquinol methylase UbiE [unclassified Wenzhouxiangella]|uniref:bifunctional demethylmenaquinone methyltransferase/2-methoxy-6-polyprenyl-1,4-benzoquinol methylase UbiE n=1 Tax=unclassified Wenzhouxiangella TaxID=2613841 RepID=UPI000E32CFCB|nr:MULTISPECIES: bifunctional demethylmenaquinone methyltransferase/2-methoxy-6-polyprenyl-1,4-benzoquinol methylase UbiE [unclassified Wenzhouxiangella]RFF28755.1 bifunctional demethylmenaquinone methyltransferase/2-methoxy-6-polyprenyl-1,4-benzoquinol methylase UbiE [Wenzhouxiangella sp. 15181]RFP67841.1 bifunctional demethylmenaquinone methyltransferase/2-methoxy-6-polyprenyl-1,4-benzoquinol methylase UbiE [Wenzhouxiangella sp. 15190]
MTDFGYRDVSPEEKTQLVDRVFSSVAKRYDLMNDLMSLGIHRLWKRHFVATCGIRAGHKLLDLAGGTGDIAKLARERGADVIVADINREMLATGRSRMDAKGLVGGLEWLQVNAEALPFAANHFDHLTIAFGLRNVTWRDTALAEMYRVLRPGGRVHILEFSKVGLPALAKVYDTWSFQVLPRLGAQIAGDAESYQYLAESIRRFPDQPTLAEQMREAGFERVDWSNLSGGICAIHRGAKV